MLGVILRPINEDSGRKIQEVFTFKNFLETVYLPIYRHKWKISAMETEEYRLQAHLVRSIGDQLLTRIDRERLQTVLNGAALITRFAIFEGMRPSEILGLQWQDLDVDSVWVRRRAFKSNVDTPKNERSARRVALFNGTARLLNGWLQDHVGTTRMPGYFRQRRSKHR